MNWDGEIQQGDTWEMAFEILQMNPIYREDVLKNRTVYNHGWQSKEIWKVKQTGAEAWL